MGVSRKLVLDNGIEIDNAYFMISHIQGTQENINITVSSFVNREHMKDNKPAINSMGYSFKPDIKDDASNFIRQGYVYLKTLDYFKDSIDVFELNQTPI